MIRFFALHLVVLIFECGVHLITTRTPDHLYIHELTVTAQQLASVAQLVRALHRNRRAVGSIPTIGPCTAFFAVVPGQILKCIYILTWIKPGSHKIVKQSQTV